MAETETKPKTTFSSAAQAGRRYEKLRARLRDEKKAREAAERERDELKANPAPAEVVKERDDLKSQIREGKHKAEFAKLCKEAKVRDEAVDDLWTLSGVKADADDPDPKALKAAIESGTKARPHFLAGEAGAESAARPLARGEDGNRGGRSEDVGKVTYTKSDISDPVWMHANQARFRKDQSEGKAVIID